jgi:ketosteroid isomerase-like protein
MDGASDLPEDFDQIAIVVDWLDACRKRDLEALLDLYAPDARLECRCGGPPLHEGRAALEAYWRPLLEHLDSAAYKLQEIAPITDGVALDCLDSDGKPVRVLFSFTADGKIARMRCATS